jgi:Icc-related predicted phosphoesterase
MVPAVAPSKSMNHLLRIAILLALLGCVACTRSHSQTAPAPVTPVDLQLPVRVPFHFVVYGDTRFTDPGDTDAANAEVRQALVQAIADAHPAFISIGGDIAYNGQDASDWKVWDRETAIWRDDHIPVFPALGNHDLHGDLNTALANYFQRFPDLKNSRYYSVRTANILLLVLDSSLEELSGPQGEWLAHKFDALDPGVEFILVVLHHPPYTSSSDAKTFGGGHSARAKELELARNLETRQQQMHARIVVFSGHVHNYERHEHGGVTYFVTAGGGAHAYPIERAPDDPFRSKEVNYHYLLADVDRGKLSVTMHRLQFTAGKPVWTQPDAVSIPFPARGAAGVGSNR